MDRRSFTVRIAALATSAVLPRSSHARATPVGEEGEIVLSLNANWSFRSADATTVESITLPHCVTKLSWQRWSPESWQRTWIYRKTFVIPENFHGKRLVIVCERAMANTRSIFNGHAFPLHEGGFLPLELEITDLQRKGENELILEVDARWLDIPPAGSPIGPSSVDYYLPGGVPGSVELHASPRVVVRDLIASPMDVLGSSPRLDISLDLHADPEQDLEVRATLLDGEHRIARRSSPVSVTSKGTPFLLTMYGLTGINLWDIDNPKLYDLQVDILHGRKPVAMRCLRVGFRDARFKLDGFYLNGRRLKLFGLNRHELFPYVGFAASKRAMRADVRYLRQTLNCNIVRCSHYPQSAAFLDACDEAGLLVWEEIPGWQYIGDRPWQDVAVRNTEDMIRRDRHHPAIVIWGTRVNESANNEDLYRRTREAARRLDPGRPTSGSMTPSSRKDWKEHWHEDVFAFDDYHADPDGTVGIDPALPGVPYMLAEAVGQYSYGTAKNFLRRYRRAGKPEDQRAQPLLHAMAHSRAANDPRNAGVIAWCAFDYASPINSYNGVKCPGVVDTFRIPKLGAAFYMSQISPTIRPVVEPGFYWDVTSKDSTDQPAIFSNCDELHVFSEDRPIGSLKPDHERYPNLLYPPFFIDLPWASAGSSPLKIEGLVDGKVVITRDLAGSRKDDRLWLKMDDRAIVGDGSDSTRVSFGVEDKFGNTRPSAQGSIDVRLTGPATLIGDTRFDLAETGAVGAVWVRGNHGPKGWAAISIHHPDYGERSIEIEIQANRA